jgi:hypothetical protein
MPQVNSKERIPLYLFARDILGYFYLKDSLLRREVCEFAETVFHAWLDTRHKLRQRVKALALVPRKTGKSTIITQSLVPYSLSYDPDLAWVIDSETKQKANDFLGPIARVMSGKSDTPFTGVLGNWKSSDPESKWREDMVDIAPRKFVQRKEHSIGTSSVEIGYTGGAPDCIVIDDPMSPETHNDAWMKKVTDHYEGYGPVLMPNGLFMICMTRYDDSDLAGYIERTEGWHISTALEADKCIRRGRCDKATEQFPQPWHVLWRDAWDDSKVTRDDICWTTEFLRGEEKKNPHFFAAQFLNNPWHNPDSAFQPEDFIYTDIVPQDVSTILTTDIAWKDAAAKMAERGGDWNVFNVSRHQRTSGKVYVTRIDRGRWTQGEWGDHLVKILREEKRGRWPVSRMTYEEFQSGAKGALAETVRSACSRWGELAPALVVAPRSKERGAKESRIKGSAMYFQNHQVVFARPCKNTEYNHNCEACATFQILRNELLKLGATRFDDCADTMADHFIPAVYHAPAAHNETNAPPRPLRPFDDDLKPGYAASGGSEMYLDDEDRPHWRSNDEWDPREPI